MDSKAIRPQFYSNLPSVVKEKEIGKGISDEERFLYSMSNTAGWKIFTEKKDALLKDMDTFQEASIANGATREVIGDNTIIISMVKGVLTALFNKVQDSKEACEQSTDTGGK